MDELYCIYPQDLWVVVDEKGSILTVFGDWGLEQDDECSEPPCTLYQHRYGQQLDEVLKKLGWTIKK